MKKAIKIGLALCLCTLTMMACHSKTGGTDVDNVNKVQKWADVVKTYPMLLDFPAYEYEMENVQYSNSHGLESVTYFDYKCEKSCYDNYVKTIQSSNFAGNDYGTNANYSLEKDGATLRITMSYSGGSFTCQYSKETD